MNEFEEINKWVHQHNENSKRLLSELKRKEKSNQRRYIFNLGVALFFVFIVWLSTSDWAAHELLELFRLFKIIH